MLQKSIEAVTYSDNLLINHENRPSLASSGGLQSSVKFNREHGVPSTAKPNDRHFRDYPLTGHVPDITKPTRMTQKPTSPARLRVRPRAATVRRFTTRRAEPSLTPRHARRQRHRLCLEAPDRAGRLCLAGGE